MSDLGRRLRQTLDEVAPPADLDFIVAHEPLLPFWRIGRALAYAAVLVAVLGVTVVLLSRDISDDTAVDSSVTTLEGTVTTVDDGEGPSVDDLVIPIVDPPSTEPLAGTWTKTNLGLDGLLVMPRDLIWDGDSFYLMQRVAFGDMRVWRSPNGLDWTELPSIGTFTMEEGGPEALTSYGAGLVAGGRVGDEATMWTFDGSGWTEVPLGLDAWVSDVASNGNRLVAVGTWFGGGMIPERHAHLWSSSDGLTWDEHDPSVFGEFSTAVGVVSFSGRFFAVANSWTSDSDGARVRVEPKVLTSVDGVEWDLADTKIGVATLGQVQATEVLSLSSSGSTVYLTADGESWGRILVDRSGTDPDHAVPADWWFEGRLLTLGGVERTDPRFGDVAHPMAWSYRGDGEWTEMGSGLEGMGTGLIGNGVAGNGVFVASGHGATAGSSNDGWVLYTFVPDSEAPATGDEVSRPPYSDGECSAADLGPFRDDHLLDAQLLDRAAATQQTRLALIDSAIACDFDAVAAMASSDWPDNEFGWGSFWGAEGLTADRLRQLDATDHAMWDLAVALTYTEPYWEFSECEDPGTTAWYCGREWYELPPIRGAGDYPQEWLDRIALLEGLSPDQLNDRLRGGHRPFGVVITTSGEWVAAHPRVVPDPVTLHLYVSNQSFDHDPVRIVVSADGAVVIDDEFYVEGQHNWILHDLELAPGPLQIRAVDPEMGAVLQIEVDLTSESWAVLDFWFSTEDGVPYFRLPGLLDDPPAFF